MTRFFLKTPVTPNQITLLTCIAGVVAGIFFSVGTYGAGVLGALAYGGAQILDNCDGNVARAKNMKSELGGWFDIAADGIVDCSLFVGLAIGLSNFLLGAVCVVGVFCHLVIVIIEKIKGFGPAVFNQSSPKNAGHENIFLKLVEALREGESSWLVLGFSVTGQTYWLLALGALYMQALWIGMLCLNFRFLVTPNETR